MELKEQVTALEAEKKQYIAIIENLNCEKIALDQMLVEALKNGLESRKNSLLKDAKLNELMAKTNELQTKNNELETKIIELTKDKEMLQNSISVMQSDANCGG